MWRRPCSFEITLGVGALDEILAIAVGRMFMRPWAIA